MNIDREAIAAALTGVDKVTGYAYRPKSPKLGDAWPLIDTINRYQGLMFIPAWKVQMWLGQDERKADAFLELVAVPVARALQTADVLFVNTVQPVILPTEAGDVFGAEFTGDALSVDNALGV